jgi:CRP/FNR family transcriptional regulator, cyclic AMP receptor protein
MTAPAGLTQDAASLLDADRTLARMLGARRAAELGHDLVLPVLAVGAGPWVPPAREALGPGVVALVVLSGLLAAGSPTCTNGPADVIEPWDRRTPWTACTPVRLAVIGSRFIDAVREWPAAAATLLARAHERSPAAAAGGTIDERALDLLWRIAARWGVLDGADITLPRVLDKRALAMLLDVREPEAGAAMALLGLRGSVKRDRDGWRLAPTAAGPASGHSRERRDALRSRGAQQIVRAREMRAQCTSLYAHIYGRPAWRGRARQTGD